MPRAFPVRPHDIWTGSKRQKDYLRAKYDGCCAYCGKTLTAMHADHVKPVVRLTKDHFGRPLPKEKQRMVRPERNIVANMMPACPPCNLHKGGYSLEGWRDILQRSAQIMRRANSTFKAGERFGIIIVEETDIVFHFERQKP